MKHLLLLFWLFRNSNEVKKVHATLSSSPDSPNSAVSIWQGIALTIRSSSTTTERLVELAGLDLLPILSFDDLKSTLEALGLGESERRLRDAFDENGSDKGTGHHYSYLYAILLSRLKSSREIRILEIGLGTNHVDVPSNMGPSGKPGASIRAFVQFDERVSCVGLDVDPRVLFEESRIRTAVVDQMNLESWHSLPEPLISHAFDLVIDDGLHSPTANLNTVISTLKLLDSNGVIVVEDIPERALNVWRILHKLGIQGYEIKIVAFPGAHCAVIAKTGSLPELIGSRG